MACSHQQIDQNITEDTPIKSSKDARLKDSTLPISSDPVFDLEKTGTNPQQRDLKTQAPKTQANKAQLTKMPTKNLGTDTKTADPKQTLDEQYFIETPVNDPTLSNAASKHDKEYRPKTQAINKTADEYKTKFTQLFII